MDAHSELMSHYPWAWTTPNSGDFNLADTGALSGDTLEFHDTGTPHPNAGPHDWVALVGSNTAATGGEAGPGHWGPQGPPTTCTAESQFFCDEGPFGKGTGGQLRYRVTVPGGRRADAVDRGRGLRSRARPPRAPSSSRALADPDGRARRRRWRRGSGCRGAHEALAAGRSATWPRASSGASRTCATSRCAPTGCSIRDVDEGRAYPPAIGTVAHARWIGAGYPDYPWIFATDAEYTAFAAVTVGQFEAIEDHARVLRDVSVILNGDSGKVAHEIVDDGSVYYGSLKHAGNTDETAKFPSLVALVWRWTGDDGFRDDLYPFAVRNMHYVIEQLDSDDDGWPEGLGNVERTGMGEEKLDNTVYTIRGLYDLADMARRQARRRHRQRGRATGRATC